MFGSLPFRNDNKKRTGDKAMGRYLIRRFAELILTVFLIATATFFLLEAVPGDPLTQRADHLPDQTRTALYQRYGLDKPVMERYLITMKKMCKGDFGESFVYAGQTVTGLLKTKLPVSARLGIQQMLLGVTLGLLLGIVARNLHRLLDCRLVGIAYFSAAFDIWTAFAEGFCR